jgi:hypothetical protein
MNFKKSAIRNHKSAMTLSLPLFMARVLIADHTHHVLAFDDLAAFTKSFY